MELLSGLPGIFEWVLLAYLGLAALYLLVFSVAGLFPPPAPVAGSGPKRRIAVLIPGYKEDAVILDTAREALEQDYPRDCFDVVVIADSFKAQTLAALQKMPIRLIEVSFEKSTKAKALNRAMEVLDRPYDLALVLDADNFMERQFLLKINAGFDRGYRVIQGHRIAKNTNTPFAILDAISEEINNHIFRKGHRALGFSAALIGSGMCFEYPFFKEIMSRVDAVGGFDKELELKLLKAGEKIGYLHHALVLDEKVQKAEVFSNQRRRWLSAQFIYFRRFAWSGLRELLTRGNVDFADKVYQMVTPPRILLLGLSFLLAAFSSSVALLGFDYANRPPSPLWWLVFGTTLSALLLAVPKFFYNRGSLLALGEIPRAFGIMLRALLRLKGANKKFIHTQHGTQ